MTTMQERATTTPSATEGKAFRRLPAAGGAAFAVLVLVGNGIYTDGGSETVGYSIQLLGYVALAVFLGWIATSLTATRHASSMVAVVGGVAMLAVKLGGWSAIFASKQAALAPEVAAGLVQIDESAFVLAWLPYGLFVVGLSLAAMRAGRLSRPVAWVGAVIGVACMAAVPVSTTEPFVAPWLISLLWLIVASILLARGQGGGDQAWSVEV